MSGIALALAHQRQWRTPLFAFLRRCAARAPLIGPRLMKLALVARYVRCQGRPPRLDPPQTFNEHLTYRILYDRDPRLKILCDKLRVRGFIEQALGPGYTTPLLGAWDHPAQISWDRLPQQFVLKPNHSSGPFEIVEDLHTADRAQLVLKATEWLRRDYFDISFEWGYRDLPRRVLAEPLLRFIDGGAPVEIDVFCFGGRAEYLRVFYGSKFAPERCDAWFDAKGHRQALRCNTVRPMEEVINPSKVDLVTEHARSVWPDLLRLSETIAGSFRHLRVDFYLTDQGIRIGELTAYTNGGTNRFSPPEWDARIGRLYSASP